MRRSPLHLEHLSLLLAFPALFAAACQTPSSSATIHPSTDSSYSPWNTLLQPYSAAEDTHNPPEERAHSKRSLDPLPAIIPASSTPRISRYVLLGIDCFGPRDPKTCNTLRSKLNVHVGDLIPFGWTGNSSAQSLRAQSKLAFISISPVFYPDGTAYITLDALSSEQHNTRSLPSKTWRPIAHSSSLLETYAAYSNAHIKLSKQGVALTHTTTQGFWDYRHHTLAPYVSLFRSEVPEFQKELIQIATYESEPSFRRAAAGLLGFSTDDTTSAHALSTLLVDPNPAVRIEAARALLPKLQRAAQQHAEIIDLAHVLHMLRLPSPSDRTHAAKLLAQIVRVPKLRADAVQLSFPILSKMLQAKRPGASKTALSVLKNATNKDYGTNMSAWSSAIQDL